MMRGRQVAVGVCGSIAAYKMTDVVRGLVKDGATVRVVMTPSATRFVTPATFAALSGQRVLVDLFDVPERVEHVELGRWADAFVIGAATATTLHRLASGEASEVVSATYLMCRCPVVVAPAMHTEMWEHPGVQRNVERILADGVLLVPPEEGALASGDVGIGRLADPAVILEAVRGALTAKDLAGFRLVVTAGPTREALDPVRFISNHSSGRMGFAIAQAARRRGADVTVIAGPTSAPQPPGLHILRVTSTQEMLDECLAAFDDCDAVIMAAAVADWRPARPSASKVKKADASPVLELEATTDIAAELGRKKNRQVLVGFAAETDDRVENGRKKLRSKNADLIVANTVGRAGTGFESETNDAVFIDETAADELPRMTKTELAGMILDRVASMLARRPPG